MPRFTSRDYEVLTHQLRERAGEWALVHITDPQPTRADAAHYTSGIKAALTSRDMTVSCKWDPEAKVIRVYAMAPTPDAGVREGDIQILEWSDPADFAVTPRSDRIRAIEQALRDNPRAWAEVSEVPYLAGGHHSSLRTLKKHLDRLPGIESSIRALPDEGRRVLYARAVHG